MLVNVIGVDMTRLLMEPLSPPMIAVQQMEVLDLIFGGLMTKMKHATTFLNKNKKNQIHAKTSTAATEVNAKSYPSRKRNANAKIPSFSPTTSWIVSVQATTSSMPMQTAASQSLKHRRNTAVGHRLLLQLNFYIAHLLFYPGVRKEGGLIDGPLRSLYKDHLE